MTKRIFVTIAALVLTAGASELLQQPRSSAVAPPATINTSTDAAYRDGLFLGGRAAKTGNTMHASVGRWSAEQDRDAFLAGYVQGYTHPDNAR